MPRPPLPLIPPPPLGLRAQFCIRPFVGGASESSQEKASKAGGKAKSFDAQRDDNAHKFGECALRVLYYAPMFFVAIYLADLESYWPDLENCWRDVRNGYGVARPQCGGQRQGAAQRGRRRRRGG